jgi:hypothetical protein
LHVAGLERLLAELPFAFSCGLRIGLFSMLVIIYIDDDDDDA